MKGVDTNILIRFLTKDDEEQFRHAYQLLVESDEPFLISYPTLVEMIWVLSSNYAYSKKKLSFILDEIYNTENFYFADQAIVLKAIQHYKENDADFADCLIGTLNNESNCTTTYTFDKQASRLSTYTLLE